ncbi:MAG: mandelate racemase/muconate lactonizing enzyme family protein, partial [Clostridia bacterium]|nr:mandelate racemase/muconate lactonizing enzyme family protein [Clostridia bacterium]
MKIVSVDAMLLPEEKPSFTNSRPVLCRVNTDEGVYGLGEAGTTFFVGSDAVFAMIKEMSRLIIGMNPMENEVIWNKLYTSCYWPKGNGAIVMALLEKLEEVGN